MKLGRTSSAGDLGLVGQIVGRGRRFAGRVGCNPLMWAWAYGRLRRKSERACDDAGISGGVPAAEVRHGILLRVGARVRKTPVLDGRPALSMGPRPLTACPAALRPMLNPRVERKPRHTGPEGPLIMGLVVYGAWTFLQIAGLHVNPPRNPKLGLFPGSRHCNDAKPIPVGPPKVSSS